MNIPREIANTKRRIHTISWEIAELEGILETQITDFEYYKIYDKINALYKTNTRLKLCLTNLENKVADARHSIQLYNDAQEA